jgi:hypothetical protein
MNPLESSRPFADQGRPPSFLSPYSASDGVNERQLAADIHRIVSLVAVQVDVKNF